MERVTPFHLNVSVKNPSGYTLKKIQSTTAGRDEPFWDGGGDFLSQ